MRLRRRNNDTPEASDAREPERRPANDAQQADQGAVTGTYLTDGRSLFRVQHAITEAEGLELDEPLLELEDCATLELILCSAGALERLGLRAVSPTAEEERHSHPGRPGADDSERTEIARARL